MKNPSEEKFRRINLSNENFRKKVGDMLGGIGILQETGFSEENGFLVMKNIDSELVKSSIQLLTKLAN